MRLNRSLDMTSSVKTRLVAVASAAKFNAPLLFFTNMKFECPFPFLHLHTKSRLGDLPRVPDSSLYRDFLPPVDFSSQPPLPTSETPISATSIASRSSSIVLHAILRLGAPPLQRACSLVILPRVWLLKGEEKRALVCFPRAWAASRTTTSEKVSVHQRSQ